jgi:hypothetical protein
VEGYWCTWAHTHTHTHTQSRTALGKGPAGHRDLYLTTCRLPCPRRDSNLQSQKASGRQPVP